MEWAHLKELPSRILKKMEESFETSSPRSKRDAVKLHVDGHLYNIVANPPPGERAAAMPGGEKDTPSSDTPPASPAPSSGQGSGKLTIVRRSSGKKHDESSSHESSETESIPVVDAPDACDKAATRLRSILHESQHGHSVPVDVLSKNLRFAIKVLETVYLDETKRLVDEDDELSEVQPDAVPPEVREWLTATFTRQVGPTKRRSEEKPKFRSVAHAIRAGIFVDRIYRRVTNSALMQFPPEVVKVLKTLDEWNFDVFSLNEAANRQPIKYLSYDLLNRYGIFHKFKMVPTTLDNFLNRVEQGYVKYKNPYHNNLHATDVTQTVHYMLCQTGLMNWLTDLEIFATLIAALIHDFEHTGTTNNFHVMSGTDTALLYNDRAVLENHHISASFRMLREDDCNILHSLSQEEFREFRTLVIDMVLATDMSYHFQQLKNMKSILAIGENNMDKSKVLSLVLHCCDISHPAKQWNLHHVWTDRLLEEFFRQGDMERALGLPFSPLCDRNNTLVAESQIGFIDFIVEPSLAVCADMLEAVLLAQLPASQPTSGSSLVSTGEQNEEGKKSVTKVKLIKPWIGCLAQNRTIWKEKATQEANLIKNNKPEEGSSSEKDEGNNKTEESVQDGGRESKTEKVEESVQDGGRESNTVKRQASAQEAPKQN